MQGKHWIITVPGYGEAEIFAASRGKAMAQAWRSAAFEGWTYKDFLKVARSRRGSEFGGSLHADDGYAYVRRNYPDCYNPVLGDRIRAEGRTGTVIAPGDPSTAYIHFVDDETGNHSVCHPMGAQPLETSHVQ